MDFTDAIPRWDSIRFTQQMTVESHIVVVINQVFGAKNLVYADWRSERRKNDTGLAFY